MILPIIRHRMTERDVTNVKRVLAIAMILGLIRPVVWAAEPSVRTSATVPNPPAGSDAGDHRNEARTDDGLRLLITLASNAPTVFLPGQAIPMEVELLNVSKARAYLVVKPGDGSESGWREPHVYYTAERSGADGGWTRMEPTPILRCGLYDNQWQKDVVTLKPDERLPLKDWLLPPSSAFEFQQAGRYRIRAHYAYRGGQGGKGNGAKPAEDVGGMKGIDPFEIVSSPVEIAVKRPLNVTLKVRQNLIADQPARLSDLLDIAVGNDSDKPINTAHPTLSAEGRLTLQMRAELGWGPTLDKQDNPHAAKLDIQPGQSVSLLGKGAFANGVDGTWTYPRAETVKLRAGYTPSTWKDIGTVWSEWVEVKVEPPLAVEGAPSALDGPSVHNGKIVCDDHGDIYFADVQADRSERDKAADRLSEAGPAAGSATLPHADAFRIQCRKPADHVAVTVGADTTSFTVTSPSGIGSATIERTGPVWPASVILRLDLKGLEGIETMNVGNKKRLIGV